MYSFLQKKQLPKGIEQTIITGFGNYISAFVSALAIIIISRNLGPSLFGVFSAAFSLSTIVAKLNDAGITIATQKFASQSKDKLEVLSIVHYGYKLKYLVSLTLIIFLLPLSQKISELFKISDSYIVPMSVLLGLLLVYYEQLIASLLAIHSFVSASLVNLTQASFKLLTAAFLSFFYPQALFLLLGSFLLAPGIPFLLKKFFEPTWFYVDKIPTISVENKKRVLSLAKHSALLVFVLGIIDSVGVLFVKGYLTSYEAGLLGGISKISLLFTLIGVSLAQVLNNRVSRYTNKVDMDLFIKKAFLLMLLSFIFFLITLPFIKIIILVTIGREYLEGATALIVLLASVFTYIVSVPFTALFYSFESNKYFSNSGLMQLVVIIATNFLLVPHYGIIGSAFAQLISRLTLLFFTLYSAYVAYREKFTYEK